jgi:peroxiredoxin (alkyl hydroperoxide reductase subunit C)
MYDDEEEDMGGDNVPYRATYLIDEKGQVFHESVNHFPIGRNVQEYIRLIDAFTHVQTHGEVCPANWDEGKDAMDATRSGVAEYLSKN